MCGLLGDTKMATTILDGSRFSILGFCDDKKTAQRATIDILIELARAEGVVRDFANLQRPGKRLVCYNKTKAWLDRMFNKEKVDCITTRPPSLFDLPKWKSSEFENPPNMKWRDIISYSSHFLRDYSKIMGRGLQVLVRELSMLYVGRGFHRVQGVRDQLQALGRLTNCMGEGVT